MTTSDLYFTPVNFDEVTVLLGRISHVRAQRHESSKEKWPAEIVLTNDATISIPLTVEEATQRMYRRAAEFKRAVRG